MVLEGGESRCFHRIHVNFDSRRRYALEHYYEYCLWLYDCLHLLLFHVQHAGGAFSLLAGALNRVTVTAQPLSTTPSGRSMFVHLVDVDSHALVAAWRLLCTQAPPAVTRTYNVQCGIGICANKKIPYRNDWDRPRTYGIVASGGGVSGMSGSVFVKEPRLCIQPRSSGNIRLAIGPVWAVGTEDVMLFVNDESGQNEETLLLHLLFK